MRPVPLQSMHRDEPVSAFASGQKRLPSMPRGLSSRRFLQARHPHLLGCARFSQTVSSLQNSAAAVGLRKASTVPASNAEQATFVAHFRGTNPGELRNELI